MKKQPTLDELLEKFNTGGANRSTFRAIASCLKKNYVPPTPMHKILASEIAKGIRNTIGYNLDTESRRKALQYAFGVLKKGQISVYDLETIETKLARAEIYTIPGPKK